ncbi:hypothetical protein [Brevibacillus sp. SIMBA_076]
MKNVETFFTETGDFGPYGDESPVWVENENKAFRLKMVGNNWNNPHNM